MKQAILTFLSVLSVFVAAQQIESAFPEEKLYIGDRITAQYRIFTEENTQLYPPEPAEYIKGLEIIKAELSFAEGKKENYWLYKLETAAFDTGFVLIPELPLLAEYENKSVTDTIILPEKYLYIHSILDSTAAALPLKPPKPLSVLAWWEYLLLALLLAAIVFFVRLAVKSKKPGLIEDEQQWQCPAECAENMLKELEKKAYLKKGDWKAFYLELTMICRLYYEGIFFVHLRELTTAELLPVLHERLPESRYGSLEDFFRFADLVKFARTEATEERGKEDLQMIRRLIAEQERELREKQEMAELLSEEKNPGEQGIEAGM